MTDMRMMVLGAGGPAADNYIKSLRLADPEIYTLGVDTHPLMLELSCASETVCIDTRPVYPGDTDWADVDHANTILRLVDEYGITMVHAQPDQEAWFLSLSWTEKIPRSVPHEFMVTACQDKLECATMLGDLAPESYEFTEWSVEAENRLDEKTRWMRARTGAGSLAAKRVDSWHEASSWQTVWNKRLAIPDFMLSEYLPGEDRSYTGVWWRGEPVASACRVRVEYADTRTPSGQCSSPRIAKLDSRPETFDVAEAAIRRVSEATGTVPHGVFYVDMREHADGRLLVTEINAGRFNTTQNFYAEAGLNLPYVHACLHHEGRVFKYAPQVPGRLLAVDDVEMFWLRQPDMGHKLVVKTRVTA